MRDKKYIISSTRDLASQLISIVDQYTANAGHIQYSGVADAAEDGGLSNGDPKDPDKPGDFGDDNAGLTREDILTFYATMAELLAPLTKEQKAAIYRVAR